MIIYSELTTPTASPSPTKPSKLVPEGIDILLATLKVSLLTTPTNHTHHAYAICDGFYVGIFLNYKIYTYLPIIIISLNL